MSELEDRFVKRGYWVNHRHGPVMGQTYTVESQTGMVIVALLTILASVASAQFWNLSTFLIHQKRAHGDPSDGLFSQHQVLLRTMPTPTAFLSDSLKLSWRWKSKISHSFLQTSLLLAFAIFSAIAAIAAGISTSYTIDSSNIEVLVKSPLCGRVNYTKIYTDRSTSTLLASLSESIQTYAARCYQNVPSLPAWCHNTFSHPNISFTAVPAPCPWNTSMCAAGKEPALALDSGFVDMRIHFGLNVQVKDTVKFRRKTVCNVLPREGRIYLRDAAYWEDSGFSNYSRTSLEYGTYRNTPAAMRPEATFAQPPALSEYQATFQVDAIGGFLHSNNVSIGIEPLPEMQRDDADVSLIGLWSNNVQYEIPVNDPLFTAHQYYKVSPGGGMADHTRYKADYPAGVIGCAQQYQFCHSREHQNEFCTPLSGSESEVTATNFPDASPVQFSVLQALGSATQFIRITLGPEMGMLLASKSIMNGVSEALPDDQWIRELVGWEAITWTAYQMLISSSVIGPKVFDEFADEYREVPNSVGDQKLCQSLKMRKSGGFANINVFALSFIVTFATVITVFNWTVLRFFIFLSRFRRALAPRIERWVQDGIFQLQRRAFEAQGEGSWIDLEKEVPITSEREMLAQLPITLDPLPVVIAQQSKDTSQKDMALISATCSVKGEPKEQHREDTAAGEKVEVQLLGKIDLGLTLSEEFGFEMMASVTDICEKQVSVYHTNLRT
ncbi:hypothetical protein P280DRAFT_67807 [Massarina eburnea CBS 473.64]|uniref:Uncharacterized protein n=1 Tax=Massarina eburnea CBS 473.64 TaxID=1395130 RepID=A0A6A6RWY3_9PLEO|nr:hypothetical protein P280DRAFT_67807 [Massarina eburnea CBS 473.64]